MDDTAQMSDRSDRFFEEDWNLVAAVQQSFEVQFTREELNRTSSVQILCDLLKSKLGAQAPERCLTTNTFYKVRRALIGISNAPRESITPELRLAALLPIRRRRRMWQELEDSLNRFIPPLIYPNAVWALATVLSCLLVRPIAHYFSAPTMQDFGPNFGPRYVHFSGEPAWLSWTGAVLIAVSVWGLLLGYLLAPLSIKFPNGCETVGELVKSIVARNFKIIANGVGGWNERELFESVKLVFSSELGIDPGQVRADTPFPFFV